MTVPYIEAMRRRYGGLGYPPYNWYRSDGPPAWQPLRKPLAQSRLGVVTTSGAYRVGQRAYHYKDDTSIRSLPSEIQADEIRFSHITENYLTDTKRDPNCLLPLAALRRMQRDGEIGQLADEFFSCMGGIYSQRRVQNELAPNLAEALMEQNVDAVMLVAM